MKKYLLSLLMILTLLFIACGNEPPEEFYEGTPEDSTQIHDLLDQNADLTKTDDMFDPTYILVTLDSVEFFIADSYYRAIDTIVKIHVDSCGLDMLSQNSALDFWFTRDTSCTVYLYDTFTVMSLMHYDEKHTGYYFWAGDTDIQLDTVLINTTPGYDDQQFTGNGYRLFYFDPVRDMVIDEETGDTLYPVREPHEFVFKRFSYGTYNLPAAGTDIPIIEKLLITFEDGTQDSIIRSSSDTTYAGHVMNRLRSVDSMLVVPPGETLGVAIELAFGQVTDSMCSFYASCGGMARTELDAAVGSIVVSGTGVTNLYFEAVVWNSYYYVIPEADYKAQTWLIPVRIQ